MASAIETTSVEIKGTKSEPENVAEVIDTVREAGAKNLAIAPAGGLTSFDYGSLRARADVRLSSLKLNRVIDYPADDMTITVEAGLRLSELQKILAVQNQYLPVDPPQGIEATVGGVIATGWTGPRRHQAMRPRDQLIGVAFVTGTGTVARGGGRVVKNVAGYDFPKLLTGSSGSLGMITELTFKVRPRPESTAVAFIQVHTAQELDDYLTRLNTSMTRPTAIEVLCRKAAQGLTQKLGMALSNYTVALFFDESAKAVNWQLDQLKKEAPAGSEINILKDEPAKIEQDELTERLAGAGSKLVARAVVAPSRLVQLIEKAAGPWSIQAHAGQGIATLIPAHGVDEIEALESVSQLRKVVGSIGGTVTMAVCPNEWKPAIDVWGPRRPDWDLMIGVKRALDPQSLFNPGVLPGSL